MFNWHGPAPLPFTVEDVEDTILAISIFDVWDHLNKTVLKKRGTSNKGKMAE